MGSVCGTINARKGVINTELALPGTPNAKLSSEIENHEPAHSAIHEVQEDYDENESPSVELETEEPAAEDETVEVTMGTDRPEPPTLVLTDWAEHRTEAEMARLIMIAAQLPYTNSILTEHEYNVWLDQHPDEKLPALYIDGKMYPDLISALRYLLNDFAPECLTTSDNWLAAKMDMHIESFQEMRGLALKVLRLTDDDELKETWAKFEEDKWKPALKSFERGIVESGHGFIVGTSISWVDIAVADFLFTVKERHDHQILGSYPECQSLIGKVTKTDNLKDYLQTRGIPEF